MSETSRASRVQWGWCCVGPECSARHPTPAANEAEAAKPASAHARDTGHVVSWGILVDGRLR